MHENERILKFSPLIRNLYNSARESLGFEPHVSISIIDSSKNANNPLGKTAHYSPSEHKIALYTRGRHIKDIMRSLAHELVHHNQNCRGDFENAGGTMPGYAQEDGHLREMEREAYEVGNLIFRDWEDKLKDKGGKPLFTSTDPYVPAPTSGVVGGRLVEENKMTNKLTKSQLQRMVDEEFRGILNEASVPPYPMGFLQSPEHLAARKACLADSGCRRSHVAMEQAEQDAAIAWAKTNDLEWYNAKMNLSPSHTDYEGTDPSYSDIKEPPEEWFQPSDVTPPIPKSAHVTYDEEPEEVAADEMPSDVEEPKGRRRVRGVDRNGNSWFRRGARGEDVCFVQSLLAEIGYGRFLGKGADTKICDEEGAGIDGIFGGGTEKAVIEFQKEIFPGQEDEHDGIVGHRTRQKLDEVIESFMDPEDEEWKEIHGPERGLRRPGGIGGQGDKIYRGKDWKRQRDYTPTGVARDAWWKGIDDPEIQDWVKRHPTARQDQTVAQKIGWPGVREGVEKNMKNKLTKSELQHLINDVIREAVLNPPKAPITVGSAKRPVARTQRGVAGMTAKQAAAYLKGRESARALEKRRGRGSSGRMSETEDLGIDERGEAAQTAAAGAVASAMAQETNPEAAPYKGATMAEGTPKGKFDKVVKNKKGLPKVADETGTVVENGDSDDHPFDAHVEPDNDRLEEIKETFFPTQGSIRKKARFQTNEALMKRWGYTKKEK